MNDEEILKPISKAERYEILDILRGFALYGVLISNLVWYFSGYGELDQIDAKSLITAKIDIIVLEIETFLVVNKFVTIFSFLFGIGFAIQLNRVNRKNLKFISFYVRRMLYLFLFGVIHFTFLLYTDILHLYAILGVLLILFRSMNNKRLFVLGIAFTLIIPVLWHSIVWSSSLIFGSGINLEQSIGMVWDDAAVLKSAFRESNYYHIIKANLADIKAWFTTDEVWVTGISSLGLFILGYQVGKSNLLSKIKKGLSTKDSLYFTKALKLSLVVGIVFQGILMFDLPFLTNRDILWVRIFRDLFWRVGVFSLALFYVLFIVYLYTKNKAYSFLHFFSPVGRMALTNYVGQSVFAISIFYGIGLGFYGKVGPFISIILATIIFIIQLLLSRWWLSRFRFGPLEWIWRSLTYGRLENLIHSTTLNK